MKRVLIATPTWEGALREETQRSVLAQVYEPKTWRVVEQNPFPAPDRRNVLASYQRIRDIFLSGLWESLLLVEHDMVLPPLALADLLALNVPVAYGVYLLRHGALVLNTLQYNGDRNLGESLTLKERGPLPTKPQRVSGVGFGCTLIERAVVERIPFHDGGDTGQSPDLPFALDCLHQHVPQWAHFGVLCGHLDGERLLMPGRDDVRALTRIRALTTLNARVEGASLPLLAGVEYEMPIDDADHLLRAGYAERTEDAALPRNPDPLLQKAEPARTKRAKPARSK